MPSGVTWLIDNLTTLTSACESEDICKRKRRHTRTLWFSVTYEPETRGWVEWNDTRKKYKC